MSQQTSVEFLLKSHYIGIIDFLLKTLCRTVNNPTLFSVERSFVTKDFFRIFYY